jgi:hypothetical protein
LWLAVVQAELQVKSRGGISFRKTRRRAAVRIALRAAASMSFVPELEESFADLTGNVVPFFRIWNLTTTIHFFLSPLIRVPGTVRET